MSGGDLGTRRAMTCSAGMLLGSRYTLQRQAGSGGYSEVWAAHDAVLDRSVAIKLLYAEYARHTETLQRFRTEAQLAAQLSDANIARVYDFRDTDDDVQPYLVMEFVDGPTLAQILRHGPLPPARALDIVAQAAAGLEAAHSAGMVHRDIKPSNIMIAPGNVVKLTDFGLSHTLESAPITRAGMVAGTPGYMAPERAAGVRATAASDLYSLGVVGYECLSGAPPFEGTPIEVALSHRDYDFPPLPAATPGPVADLIADLTEKDPARRPASAGAVALAAARLRDSLPARPGADALTPPPTADGGADGHTVVVPVPLGGYGTVSPGDYGDQLQAAYRRGPGLGVGWLLAGALGLAAVIAIVAVIVTHLSQTPAAATPPPRTSHSSQVQAVDVSRSSLVGEPAQLAYQQLRSQGFRVRVQFRKVDGEHTGTVLNVKPAGLQPPNSLITLIVAVKGHHGDHGNGNGDGNGGGND